MRIRHIFMLVVTIILATAVTIGLVWTPPSMASDSQAMPLLDNVRDLKLATDDSTEGMAGASYAIDGGRLYMGRNGHWTAINTPSEVILSTVAVDPGRNGTVGSSALYIGAANSMAIYRSINQGIRWQRIPLSKSAIGGVTAIAIDTSQRLVYVGTDTAGIFRLRDVGSSMILSSQVLLDKAVRQIVVDDSGSGLVLARTDWELLRAENYGLTWITVDNLGSSPTAITISPAGSAAARSLVLVGTVDRGLIVSLDGGHNWQLANDGLNFVPGSRLSIDALAIDPGSPDVLYLSTSYLFGSTSLRSTPKAIAMTTDRAQTWTTLDDTLAAAIVELIPLPGQIGQLYAFTAHSRAPLAVGNTPALVAAAAVATRTPGAAAQTTPDDVSAGTTAQLAWIVAGLAALALAYALLVDLRVRRRYTDHRGNADQKQPIHNRTL